MQIIAKFKGKSKDGIYYWERLDDNSPKQLYTKTCPTFHGGFYPMVNQLYLIGFNQRNGSELIGNLSVQNYYQTCGIWKYEGNELIFKKGENKGLTVTQYVSCFPNNTKERKKFMGYLSGIYKTTVNPHTRNNVLRIYEEWIKYCDIFGYDENNSVILVGGYKGVDITKVPENKYILVRKRLENFKKETVNPITKRNCEKWVNYLDKKFN